MDKIPTFVLFFRAATVKCNAALKSNVFKYSNLLKIMTAMFVLRPMLCKVNPCVSEQFSKSVCETKSSYSDNDWISSF